MADDQLRDIIQGLRSRLQDELEAQLETLARSHEQTLDEARRAADAEAEQRLSSRLETANQEFTSRLERELSAVRAEADQRLADEAARLRLEASQAAAESATRSRLELEQSLAEERERARQQLESERQRAEREFAETRAALERELAETRGALERKAAEHSALERDLAEAKTGLESKVAGQTALETRLAEQAALVRDLAEAKTTLERELSDTTFALDRKLGEHAGLERELAEARTSLENERRRAEEAIETAGRSAAPGTPDSARLLQALRGLDQASSLSDVLTKVTNAAAAVAPRATLFIVNTDHLEPWTVDGAASMSAGPIEVDGSASGLLGEAVQHHQVVDTSSEAMAPAFASLPSGRSACAVPFMLGGQPVAVLYADEGPEGAAPPAWQDAVQILGRHASACLAHLTASRTTQAMRLLGGHTARAQSAGNGNDEEQGARRYARLLVSEIKLYNEPAVRLGRQKRDLGQRLRAEIDRARRLYDERVPASIHARDAYFQQELVQTLADGDPALLG